MSRAKSIAVTADERSTLLNVIKVPNGTVFATLRIVTKTCF